MAPKPSDASSKLRSAVTAACRGLVDREPLVELVALSAVAREHLLVIGPPGTAKSVAVRLLIYSYAKGVKPVLRMEIGIEGRCNPRVRFDGLLLTIADDLGHLRAYELTYGEQIRDLTL
jgi:hypothetical protein